MSDERVRVMVVDDHPVWRDGVRGDLEASGRAVVVAEASDGGEAIERAREVMPELVLMDLNLPTVRGVEAIRRIVEEWCCRRRGRRPTCWRRSRWAPAATC